MDGLGEVARNGNDLAMHARLLRFTPATEKTFPVTCYTIGRATTWARQTSQGEATTLLDLDTRSRSIALGRELVSPAMADRRGENSPHYLTVGKKPIEMTPIGS